EGVGAAERGEASETVRTAEAEEPRAADHEMDDGGSGPGPVEAEGKEERVQRIERSGRCARQERLAAVLRGVPEEAVPATKAPPGVDEHRVLRRIDVGARQAPLRHERGPHEEGRG